MHLLPNRIPLLVCLACVVTSVGCFGQSRSQSVPQGLVGTWTVSWTQNGLPVTETWQIDSTGKTSFSVIGSDNPTSGVGVVRCIGNRLFEFSSGMSQSWRIDSIAPNNLALTRVNPDGTLGQAFQYTRSASPVIVASSEQPGAYRTPTIQPVQVPTSGTSSASVPQPRVETEHQCYHCFGRGEVDCTGCNGLGRNDLSAYVNGYTETDLDRAVRHQREICSSCSGSGKKRCTTCYGRGYVRN